MATEPEEFAQLIKGCNNVYKAMGSKERVVSEAEYVQRQRCAAALLPRRI